VIIVSTTSNLDHFIYCMSVSINRAYFERYVEVKLTRNILCMHLQRAQGEISSPTYYWASYRLAEWNAIDYVIDNYLLILACHCHPQWV